MVALNKIQEVSFIGDIIHHNTGNLIDIDERGEERREDWIYLEYVQHRGAHDHDKCQLCIRVVSKRATYYFPNETKLTLKIEEKEAKNKFTEERYDEEYEQL